MVSPGESTGIIIQLIVAFLTRFDIVNVYKAALSPFTLQDALGPSLRYRRARVGRFLAALSYIWVASTLVDLEAVRKTHLNINRWKDEELLAWKGSYVAGCSATAVAAAIFASVGLIALSLPQINATHWTARALLSASMAVGILSLTYATYQQTVIGMMNNAQEIRIWLSCGKADRGLWEAQTDLWKFVVRLQGGSTDYDPPYNLFPLESSMAAQMKIQLPNMLLQLAIFLYLTGFGLYLLFAWVENSIPPSLDYQAIFIVYIIAVGLVLLYFGTLSTFNEIDQQKRQQDFELDNTRLGKPISQRQLDQWLNVIQEMQELDLEDVEAYDGLAAQLNVLKGSWEEDRRAREAAYANVKKSASGLPGILSQTDCEPSKPTDESKSPGAIEGDPTMQPSFSTARLPSQRV